MTEASSKNVFPLAPPGGRDLPAPGESRRRAIDQPPLAGLVPDGLDTIVDVTAGPARGIVLAFVPGLLIWGVLIAVVVRLVK